MRVLLLNGSPHEHGCTYTALREVEKTLLENGLETELVHVGGQAFRGCVACGGCARGAGCVFDDGVNELAEKLRLCDGLVLGSPVYYAAPNGNFLSLLDRLFYSSRFDKSMKVGASVVSCRRGGSTASFDVLNKYFSISNMPIATSRYWNQVHGQKPEEVLRDEEGLQTMRTLARNMAFLIRSIALGQEQFGLPQAEAPLRTNFIAPD